MKRENIRIIGILTLLLDIVSISVSFLLSALIRGGIILPGSFSSGYSNLFIVLILASVLINFMSSNNDNIFKRSYYEELISITKEQGMIAFIAFGYMFAVQESSNYSRIFLTLLYGFNMIISYILHYYLKQYMLKGYKRSAASSKVMLVTVSENACGIIQRIRRECEWRIYVNTIALWDKDAIGEKIEGIEIVANRDNLLEMARLNVVDEVFINIPPTYMAELEELVLELEKLGVMVHINLDIFHNMNWIEKSIGEFAGHQVITFSNQCFEARHTIFKRCIDIIGGLVGCILTIILTIFMAPLILMESKGPVFFSQTRIGKNGRKFKIFKFRSMYQGAELRKQELMAYNEMEGLMFKMTDDPRITKVGKLLRKTCLDEFPQFFNVLMGNMSLVGTRPPTEDEFIRYEGRHKRRLSLKPGLTGLWQVRGRDNIYNFEEVVKMDLEYIEHCSLLLDIKLMLKTVELVLTGRGSK